MYNYTWTYYATGRTVSYSPYGIWFQKSDGPSMYAKWIYCGSTSGGPSVGISDSDPAPGVYLKGNGTAPTTLRFCLAFLSGGSNSHDTFTGSLNWDGDT